MPHCFHIEDGNRATPYTGVDARPRKGLHVRLSDLHWIDAFISVASLSNPLTVFRRFWIAASSESRSLIRTYASNGRYGMEHIPDVLLGPFLLGQKCGDVGAEARQCSSEEKVDGVEVAHAVTGWRWFNRIRCLRGTRLLTQLNGPNSVALSACQSSKLNFQTTRPL
jgi:hypothetical protein